MRKQLSKKPTFPFQDWDLLEERARWLDHYVKFKNIKKARQCIKDMNPAFNRLEKGDESYYNTKE